MAKNYITKEFEKALLQEVENYYINSKEEEINTVKRTIELLVTLLNSGCAYSVGCKTAFKLGILLQSMLERQAESNCYNVAYEQINKVIKKIEKSF
jgi:hypothetical protein